MRIRTIAAGMLIAAAVGAGAASGPATRPAARTSEQPDAMKSMSADELKAQLLRPTTNPTTVLEPVPDRATTDASSGGGAVKPDAPTVMLRREGTYIVDRAVRLTHNDKGQAEVTFDADGKALRDPPMIILPNQKLMLMEDAVNSTNRDLRFRVTGMITEYRGRNYILLEKVVVPLDITQQF